MSEPDVVGPLADDLRSWQRFVADNIEFRLGVAIGAVVAKAWAEGADGTLALPSLATWKDTTGLPWVGFWARELLRWGTHDPFVAFCLAQGMAPTREAAGARREAFHVWLEQERDDPTSEDRIDPQFFLRWQASLPQPEVARPATPTMRAALTGTTGERGRYTVIPVTRGKGTAWLDPAGFELAITRAKVPIGRRPSRSDYELVTNDGTATIRCLFRPT